MDLVTHVECWMLHRGHVLHPWGLERGGDEGSASAELERAPAGEGTVTPRGGREGGRQ